MQPFSGFTEQTFMFFMEVALHNSPATVNRLRPVFEQEVLTPLRALVRAGEEVLFEADPRMDFRPVMGGAISRLHRDTRFAKDKSPYRDHMWLDFRRKQEDWHLGFWFEISPRRAMVGMGMHGASTKLRNELRAYVLQRPSQFLALHQPLIKGGYTLDGEAYHKRMSDSDQPDIAQFAQMKWFSYNQQIPLARTMTPGFAAELQTHFRTLLPLYSFLRAMK